MSFRLLPGPQDPFCLGRAKLGLSSRHFREEAQSSCPGSGVGLRPSGGVGCQALFQGIFPTQGSNLSLLCLLH